MKQLSALMLIICLIIKLQVNAKEYESPLYTQYVDETTETFLKEVYKRYGFECGATGGEMPYDVEVIYIKLNAYRSATIEQARELEITLTERLIQIINAHEKIRPFLREYPFPSGRAHVAISFREKKKIKNHSQNNVSFVFQARNRIFFNAINSENPFGPSKTLREEPYEEALKIVQSKTVKKDSK